MEKKAFITPPPEFFTEIPIVACVHEFFLGFHKNLVKFPKTDKHTLGQEISQQTLNLLELLLGASKLPSGDEKLNKLHDASSKLELLKLLIRICFEVKAITDKQYIVLESSLQETGKMLGGWIKSVNR